MARRAVCPLAVYTPDTVIVAQNPAYLKAGLALYHAAVQTAGVARVDLASMSVLDSTDLRAYIEICWDYQDASGVSLAQSTVRYVLCRTAPDANIHIEMAEYKVLAFPGIAEQISELLAA